MEVGDRADIEVYAINFYNLAKSPRTCCRHFAAILELKIEFPE